MEVNYKPKDDIQRVALESVQHYLLTLPKGAHKEILYQIADALKDQSKMPTALYDAKYYLLKYAGDHIQNIADAGADEIPALLRQIDNALKEEHIGQWRRRLPHPTQCKYCGCTDDHACEGGCSWVAKDVCSKCASELVRVIQVDTNGKWVGQGNDWDCFGPGALLKTEQRSLEGGCVLRDQDLFVPVEAMIFTAEALLNTYQEITGEKVRLKFAITGTSKDVEKTLKSFGHISSS